MKYNSDVLDVRTSEYIFFTLTVVCNTFISKCFALCKWCWL